MIVERSSNSNKQAYSFLLHVLNMKKKHNLKFKL
jgi:hypothetical protein